jgi:tetratricopeptide (TPR) repeat protein
MAKISSEEKAFKRAIKAYNSADNKEAIRLLKKVTKFQSDNSEANHIMGLALVKDNNVKASLKFFRAALETNSGIAQYWHSYINALILMGNIQEALHTLQISKRKGCRGKAFDDLATKLASPEIKLQLKVQRFKQLIQNGSNSELTYLGLAAALKLQGKIDEALNTYRTALNLMPDCIDAYLNLSLILMDQGKLEEAVESYKKVISIKPSCAEAYNNMGVAMHRQSKLDLAAHYINKALNLNHNYPAAHINIGNVYGDQQKFDEAIHAYDTAIALGDYRDQGKHNLGELLKTYCPKALGSNAIHTLDGKIKAASSQISASANDHNLSSSLKKLLQEIHNTSPELKTNSLQIYKKNSIELNCKRHKAIFKTKEIIPKYCFNCFKIQIEVNNLLDLIRLSSIFYEIKFEYELTSKCLIEVRKNIPGTYKGLIYCSDIGQAKDTLDQLNIYLKAINSKLIGKIKRGCSEFSQSFPDYGDLSDDKLDWMQYPEKWQVHEDEFDKYYSDKARIFMTPSIPMFCLNDILIIQKWIDYAKGYNDPTAALFHDLEIKYPRMFDIGYSRRNIN